MNGKLRNADIGSLLQMVGVKSVFEVANVDPYTLSLR